MAGLDVDMHNWERKRGEHGAAFWEKLLEVAGIGNGVRGLSARGGRVPQEVCALPLLRDDMFELWEENLYLPVAAVLECTTGDAVGADLNAEPPGIALSADIAARAIAAYAAVCTAAAVAGNAAAAVVAAAVVVAAAAAVVAAAAAVVAAAVAAIVAGAADTAHIDHGALGDHRTHTAIVAGHFKFQGDLVVFAQAFDFFPASAARQEKVQTAVDAVPGVVHGHDIGVAVPADGQTRAFGAAQNLINLLTAQNPALILAHK